MKTAYVAIASLTAGLVVLGAQQGQAHVKFKVEKATVPGLYSATFIVEHGCAGSPTLAVRMQVPAGVIITKPPAKTGWTVSSVLGKLGGEYNYGGGKLSDGITELKWTGSLPDNKQDSFSFEAYLTDALAPNSTLYFPFVQECQVGSVHWVQIPRPGEDIEKLQTPAVPLRLVK